MLFFGAITGFAIIGLLSDNIGRRLSLIFCLASGTLGYLVILLAPTLFVAGIGNFLVGFGIESSFNLVVYFLSEMLDNTQRQKMLTIIQAFVPVGGMLIALAFYLMKHWKVIFFCFCFLPFIVCLLFALVFIV